MEITSVYERGVIAAIEQFTLKDPELTQYVVFTYYDKRFTPVYIGCSGDFYNQHFQNLYRIDLKDYIEYVGFVFYDNKEEIFEAKKYFIEWRDPIFNIRRYKGLMELEPLEDDFVVSSEEMIKRWIEWLG